MGDVSATARLGASNKSYLDLLFGATVRDERARETRAALAGLERAVDLALRDEQGRAISLAAGFDGAGVELVEINLAALLNPMDGALVTHENLEGVDRDLLVAIADHTTLVEVRAGLANLC